MLYLAQLQLRYILHATKDPYKNGNLNCVQYITPNLTTSGDSTSMNSNGIRIVSIEAQNSYCCDLVTTTLNAQISGISNSINAVVDFTGVDRSSATPAHSHGKRLCFMSNITEIVGITVGTLAPSPTNVEMQCNDTSLFGGYNTNANPFNFLEISNLTNESISGKIYATNFDGTVVLNGTDFTVDAGRRTDVDLHTAAGANKYGLLKIIHDGPLGALQGNVSFYSGTPAALTLRGSVPVKARDKR